MNLEMSLPTVSVVMGVKNAAGRIKETIDSVLSQKKVDLEFIIINDGSTDGTEKILQEYAEKDNRIKLFSRKNKGLTISLIEGCEIAKGEFIARQDANDVSLAGRFEAQVDALRDHQDVSFCSTFVRHVTKEGIGALITAHEGIIHGSVMMRKTAYIHAGGYRKQFYYAQDIDLWSRMLEYGKHIAIPRVYYEGLLFTNSISGTKSKEQRKFLDIIKKASDARNAKRDESSWLVKADILSKECKNTKVNPSTYANGAYFIGSCLVEHNPSLAKRYFQEAIELNHSHLRSRLRLARLK
jgi:glycosyltransferase involved in cell wall biosynthesis